MWEVTNPWKTKEGTQKILSSSLLRFYKEWQVLHKVPSVFSLNSFSTTQFHQYRTFTSKSRMKSKLGSCRSPHASPRAFRLPCPWEWELTLSHWSQHCELPLEVISFDPSLRSGLTLLLTGSHFNRASGPLALPQPDPQEIKEHVALRWPLCISTHQKHHRQVARGQDDRQTIPPFISQLQPPTSLPPENRPGNPREKRLESPCTKVTGNHKVQLSLGWREGSRGRKYLYSSSKWFILTV